MLGFRTPLPLLCGLAFLAVSPAMAQLKIAIMDTNKALTETAEMKKTQAEMDKNFKPRQEKLELLQREAQQIQQQLTTMAGKLTPQAESEMRANLARKEKDYQRLGEDLQADVESARNDVLSKAGTQMDAVVKAYAAANNFDMVIDVSNALYFKPTMEITKEITAAYDKAHPAK